MNIFQQIGRAIARKTLEEKLPGLVRAEFERQLERRLPAIIEDVLAERFKNRPNDNLSEVGFNWALALSLRALWPDVRNAEAVRWLREYIEAPYGDPGYDWSPSAAKVIAQEYVNDVGELG